jgi:CheY-like chemotaxis protein
MPSTARLSRPAATLFALAILLNSVSLARAQLTDDGFVTGAAAAAWDKWNAAMQAFLARDPDTAESMFEQLLATEPSPFRIALLADRSITRNENAGGVLLLEQDAEAEALQTSGKKIFELLETGREQMNEADDGWYFASIGRFGIANANFTALISSEPDPVALLEFADRVPKRQQILVQLAGDPIIGESVTQILKLLQLGEEEIKADPTRIKQHIERLAGPPRAFENAVARLKDSGEYAIPFLIQSLRDPEQKALTQAILRTLPQIGRPGLNPLVIALRMRDQTTLRYLIRALGQIGYWQSVPYLLKLREDPSTLAEVRSAIDLTLNDLAGYGITIDPSLPAAEAFYRLAKAYYEDQQSLAADPRLDTANVWYWKDDLLQNVEVPTPIFNEIMCLRCCEEALLLNPDLKPALALWLAADFRREAQLPAGQVDHTRPENYPTAAYFAQSAGPDYCLMALARAVDDGDPAVALGAIEALQKTAGPASIVGDQAGRLPLAEALSFPDRMVRMRAALALGNALPEQPFHNYQNLMPVLSEALLLFGGARNALVIDPDAETANLTAAALRAAGYNVITEASLFAGLERVRNELPGLDVILLASDMTAPDLRQGLPQLRGEFRFATVPVIVVAKPSQSEMVRDFIRGDHSLGQVPVAPDPEALAEAIAAVSKAVGATTITPEVGSGLALEAAMVLRLLAVTNNPLFDVEDAETALIVALDTDDAMLRETVAQVLGYLGTTAAQQAIAQIALDVDEAEQMRVTMFAALADAAKRRGNHLPEDIVQQLIVIAESDENMVIRTAASQALGALNLPSNPASVIIRNQYGG